MRKAEHPRDFGELYAIYGLEHVGAVDLRKITDEERKPKRRNGKRVSMGHYMANFEGSECVFHIVCRNKYQTDGKPNTRYNLTKDPESVSVAEKRFSAKFYWVAVEVDMERKVISIYLGDRSKLTRGKYIPMKEEDKRNYVCLSQDINIDPSIRVYLKGHEDDDWASRVKEDSRNRPFFPQYTTELRDYTEILGSFSSELQHRAVQKSYQDVKGSLLDSVDLLQVIATRACSLLDASAFRQCALGVFGSVGRMEKRVDSDVEFMVLYSGSEHKAEAITLWNMLATIVKSLGKKHEGEAVFGCDLTDEKLKQHIRNRGGPFPNAYLPILDSYELAKLSVKKLPHLRDRYFQIATELKPIYNPELIASLRLSMFRKSCQSIEELIKSQIMKEMCTSFFHNTQPISLKLLRDVKSTCFRVVFNFVLRLQLLDMLANSEKLNDSDYDHFFAQIGLPTIIKLISIFRNISRSNEELRREVMKLISDYVKSLGILLKGNLDSAINRAQKNNMDSMLVRLCHVTGRCCQEYDHEVESLGAAWIGDTSDLQMLLHCVRYDE
jgi:predicted nucleotidyltransferase